MNHVTFSFEDALSKDNYCFNDCGVVGADVNFHVGLQVVFAY